ncbi:MAG: beta strand repeat-containing protein [Henriciella sp.]
MADNRLTRLVSGPGLGLILLSALMSFSAAAQSEKNSIFIDQTTAATGGQYTLSQQGSGNSIGSDASDRFSVSGDGQTVGITQFGDGGLLTGAIVGDNVVYDILMDGVGNTVDLGQTVESGNRIDGAEVDLDIIGENNLLILDHAAQEFAENLFVDIDITGSDNNYAAIVDSNDIFLSHQIDGNFNIINSTQAQSSGHSSTLIIAGGDQNEFILEQVSFLSASDDSDIFGSGNTVKVKQLGNGESNDLTITGDGNSVTVEQNAASVASVTAQIDVNGGGNELLVVQETFASTSDQTSITGSGNLVTTLQGENGGQNILTVDGNGNTVDTEMNSVGSVSVVDTGVSGNGNDVDIVQFADSDVTSNVSISGDNNTFGSNQTGTAGYSSVASISGSNNSVDLIQFGAGQTTDSILDVAGDSNQVSVDQNLLTAGAAASSLFVTGDTNNLSLTQSGGGDYASDLSVNGTLNTILLSQTGITGSQSNISVDGASNNINVAQSGPVLSTANIVIDGNSNAITVTQDDALSAVVDVAIIGDGSTMNITQSTTSIPFE